jgi:4-hydroxybenzoate polyprenyltransferase
MIRGLLRLIRPKQWSKNAFCFAGALFSGNATNPAALRVSLVVFACFAACASAVYAWNDVLDREADRKHPKKQSRPVASGAVPPWLAILAACVLIAGGVGASSFLEGCLPCLVAYLGINVLYTLVLKHVPIFDVLCIATGFVLRLIAGVYAIGDIPTTWITLCTFFLALFLGFAKRRAELQSLAGQSAADQRPVLGSYTLEYLDSLLAGAASMSVMSYALFTVLSGKNPSLVVTVPLVYYAVMHYKHLVMVRAGGEEPERVLLTDLRLGGTIVAWLAAYASVLHWDLRLFR